MLYKTMNPTKYTIYYCLTCSREKCQYRLCKKTNKKQYFIREPVIKDKHKYSLYQILQINNNKICDDSLYLCAHV